jgi:hypothetical protein
MVTQDQLDQAVETLKTAIAVKFGGHQGRYAMSDWLDILNWVRGDPAHFPRMLAAIDDAIHVIEVEKQISKSILN